MKGIQTLQNQYRINLKNKVKVHYTKMSKEKCKGFVSGFHYSLGWGFRKTGKSVECWGGELTVAPCQNLAALNLSYVHPKGGGRG